MSANYKKLGDYITQRREKNTAINLPICGVCREGLIPPKQQDADIALYNVFYKNDFIFNPARMELNSITLNTEYDKAICSSLYEIFYINDTSKLLPEFLFVQLKTDNFVRFCEFQGQGSVREYCRFANISEYPVIVPDLKEQEKIVKNYNAITKRIQLKQKINENLEKTAQTIYKKMFVEDADEKWETKQLGDIINCFDSQRIPLSEEERANIKGFFPYYGAMSIVDYINRYIFDGDYILFSEDGINVVDEQGHPALQFLHGKFWLNNHAHILQGNDIISNELLYLQLKNTNVRHLVTGAAQPKINQKNMNSIELIIADKITTVEINKIIKPLFNYIAVNEKEIAKLQKLKQLVISRISGM